MAKVVIIGGGVAGLSAAHELVERGFSVEIYEANSIAGGKARSMGKPGTGKDGRKDLPGEHGYRFFPKFYKHITDTMKRIPYGGNKRGVYDNLAEAPYSLFSKGRGREDDVRMMRFPRNFADLRHSKNMFIDASMPPEEGEFFMMKAWQFLTSCDERRIAEYESISWWEFLEADSKSQGYQEMFGEMVRSLVAAKPHKVSTFTAGKLGIQMTFSAMTPGKSSDQLLNGPSNDVWIDPWVNYIDTLGGKIFYNARTLGLNTKMGEIESIEVEMGGVTRNIKGDYYILAVPIEVAIELLNDEIIRIDERLSSLKKLSKNVSWMNGLQIYLNQELPIIEGHVMYVGTPWAITSVSQKQFWKDIDFSEYGDGTVKDVLSIDISEWDRKGIIFKKTARECTKLEIFIESIAQMKSNLNDTEDEVLRNDMIIDWHLDPDIVSDEESPEIYRNKNSEPLLVNNVNTWHLRPTTYSKVKNLFLASDYVRNIIDLATMEGANEAARMAVNNILDLEGMKDFCILWELKEPSIFSPFKKHDLSRFEKGLPWNEQPPISMGFIQKLIS